MAAAILKSAVGFSSLCAEFAIICMSWGQPDLQPPDKARLREIVLDTQPPIDPEQR
jgi:hypothetical protein